jgi:hypothetical protein
MLHGGSAITYVEGMQLHFHISRHIAHLGWETPVFFTVSLFVDFEIYSIPITLVTFLLTAILFSLAGFINAVFAQSLSGDEGKIKS